jgi:hypothetical protein
VSQWVCSCLVLILFLTQVGFAQTKVSSEEICAVGEVAVCAHLHFSSTPNSLSESSFLLHLKVPEDQSIENLNVDLWMNMEGSVGHGSAPVTIKKVSDNHFQISNAWFVMMGVWQVKINLLVSQQSYLVSQQSYQISIPVLIKN